MKISDRVWKNRISLLFGAVSSCTGVLLTAKAFGGGMPIGAFVASSEMMDTFTHDHTRSYYNLWGGIPFVVLPEMQRLNICQKRT